ncbi:hypothetical protein L228DRAFT_21212 [Xylona heveae TC161]|uniref:YTH domain-containing protein n=1 Tax=Xylona heveae (strain CBS 132557 / TC161) TaxID=1328760 RepID=A0A165K1Y2_XYLHT|nr:hypothetical protein L228DRAFT_21212 [Xylona heveae TC161]KZF26894.1 hypothetical protein L228DRAFT_21212 [Xylona heveae TC161]
MPRGPPRKPKQSGHALWVGNLPPGTIVTDLKDHFAREATQDIESVFLISKSNCAFVNYKTEATCAAAMARFHDSRFQGVRLVCRLRRSTNNSPARDHPESSPNPISSTDQLPTLEDEPTSATDDQVEPEEPHRVEPIESSATTTTESKLNAPRVAEKFFVVKSLTVQDLELSVRNGIWTTQAHNEDALNKAYESAENVYLIFSANKSGEYFGYARMASPISEDASAALEWVPKVEAPIEEQDLPKAIPTPATEYAPKGRVIDDSARGTIFWEADNDEDDIAEVEEKEEPPRDTGLQDETSYADQAWGRPFRIEWVSTTRLPFYRTRGLRNLWNANREVKIARDGTELETNVGRRLVQMFHRYVSAPQLPNYPVGPTVHLPPGYPHLPHYS